MRITDSTLQKILLDAGKIKPEDTEELVDEGKRQKKPLQEIVLRRNLISEKELTELYAKEIDVPFVQLDPAKISKETLQLIPERIAQKYRVVLYEIEGEKLKLAMDDPEDLQAIDFLQKQLGKNMEIAIATTKDILSALDQYKGEISSELTKVITEEEGGETEEQEVSEEELSEDSPIAKTANLLIEYAIKGGASDVHIEPRENAVQVRYRIDGVLKEANRLPRKILPALVSRIKILANLKIDEHRAPQDGRFKISMSGRLFAVRVSTLPIMDGEKVVMRLLDESAKALTLEELGFWGEALETINNAIAQPHGMVLVTGPTGSGKSTTLYSILNLLNSPGVNISTVEDPVEYRIVGTNQTQTNPKAGMTFANGLRALLRQDPNIIMIGEIRDGETANLAVQAALTGHLVFSTLHTNNAATCLPRLLDMGLEPFLIASTVRAVVGQRLVRKLCTVCRISYTPEGDELREIKETFHITDAMQHVEPIQTNLDYDDPKLDKKRKSKVIEPINKDLGKGSSILERIASDPSLVERSAEQAELDKVKDAIVKDKQKDAPKPARQSDKMVIWQAKAEGCDECSHSGYKGRIGIYEVLGVSTKIQQMIVGNATSDTIQDTAVSEGMITMQQDGFVKAMQGLTTLEEVLRVTRE